MRTLIIEISGPHLATSQYEIEVQRLFTIGSGPTAHLRIEEPGVAPIHLMLRPKPDGIYLVARSPTLDALGEPLRNARIDGEATALLAQIQLIFWDLGDEEAPEEFDETPESLSQIPQALEAPESPEYEQTLHEPILPVDLDAILEDQPSSPPQRRYPTLVLPGPEVEHTVQGALPIELATIQLPLGPDAFADLQGEATLLLSEPPLPSTPKAPVAPPAESPSQRPTLLSEPPAPALPVAQAVVHAEPGPPPSQRPTLLSEPPVPALPVLQAVVQAEASPRPSQRPTLLSEPPVPAKAPEARAQRSPYGPRRSTLQMSDPEADRQIKAQPSEPPEPEPEPSEDLPSNPWVEVDSELIESAQVNLSAWHDDAIPSSAPRAIPSVPPQPPPQEVYPAPEVDPAPEAPIKLPRESKLRTIWRFIFGASLAYPISLAISGLIQGSFVLSLMHISWPQVPVKEIEELPDRFVQIIISRAKEPQAVKASETEGPEIPRPPPPKPRKKKKRKVRPKAPPSAPLSEAPEVPEAPRAAKPRRPRPDPGLRKAKRNLARAKLNLNQGMSRLLRHPISKGGPTGEGPGRATDSLAKIPSAGLDGLTTAGVRAPGTADAPSTIGAQLHARAGGKGPSLRRHKITPKKRELSSHQARVKKKLHDQYRQPLRECVGQSVAIYSPKGRLEVRFTVEADGRARLNAVRFRPANASAQNKDGYGRAEKALQRCVKKRVARWTFEPPPGGSPIPTKYPIQFR